MHVLIVENDDARQADLSKAFTKAGFLTTATASYASAERCIRFGLVDLLVMSERAGDRLTHSLSLLAEHCNPMVETILMTPRSDTEIEELFLLLPSLHCIVGPDVEVALITRLAVAALCGATADAKHAVADVDMAETQNSPLVLTSAHRINAPVSATLICSNALRYIHEGQELRKTA